MTKHEAAVIMAFTGIVTLTGDDLKYFYEYTAELLGRPTYTHEMPSKSEAIKERSKPDFVKLCRTATETEETGAAQQQHGTWKAENSRPKSYKYICSACGGTAYERPRIATKRDTPKRCSLKFCPNCGAKMDVDGGGEHGGGKVDKDCN